MKEELVSIITPMYNSEKFIEKTYESIKKQVYENWEWIVIDDNSTDRSFDIVFELQKKDSRIKLKKNKVNLRAASSRNLGLDLAVGKYVTFIDSDDLWYELFLEKQIKLINQKTCSIVFSSYTRISEDGSKSYGDYVVPTEVTYRDLLKTNYFSCLTVLYDYQNNKEIRFNEKLKLHEDYIFWLELIQKNKIAFSNNEILAKYRIRDNSVSRNKVANLVYMNEALRISQKFGRVKRLKILLSYIYYGLKKNRKILCKD